MASSSFNYYHMKLGLQLEGLWGVNTQVHRPHISLELQGTSCFCRRKRSRQLEVWNRGKGDEYRRRSLYPFESYLSAVGSTNVCSVSHLPSGPGNGPTGCGSFCRRRPPFRTNIAYHSYSDPVCLFWSQPENLNGRYHTGELGVCGKIILKSILKK